MEIGYLIKQTQPVQVYLPAQILAGFTFCFFPDYELLPTEALVVYGRAILYVNIIWSDDLTSSFELWSKLLNYEDEDLFRVYFPRSSFRTYMDNLEFLQDEEEEDWAPTKFEFEQADF